MFFFEVPSDQTKLLHTRLKTASQNQIKLLRKLKQRKHRLQEQLFLVEGERAVAQVLQNGLVEIEGVFVSGGRSPEKKSANGFEIDAATFNEIANTDSPQGILALCKTPDELSLSQVFPQEGILVATDAIQDPGNLGTIIRTSVWYAAKGILLGEGTVDLFNPKVVRSTAGATGALPYKTGNLSDLFYQFEDAGWVVVLLDGNTGAEPIQKLAAHRKIILVVGNEANGVNPELIQSQRHRVSLPSNSSQKQVESLNAGVAMGIALAYVNNSVDNL